MEKLILRKPKPRSHAWKCCNIYPETHAILAEISQETGLQMAYIISEMVEFSQAHLEIVEE